MATMFSGRLWFIVSSTAASLFCSVATFAAPTNTQHAARAERTFLDAQRGVQQEPTNVSVMMLFARAAFEWGEFARNDAQRESIAQQGIDLSRRALRINESNAAAHYWLAMNLGQLARTKMLGALKLVREMEIEFLRARELDASVDYAGPDRSLGMLYRDAPGWPTSIGNRRKARQHLENAVKLAPHFPENQLCLLESYQQWDERQNFERQLKATLDCLAATREKFTGADWEWTRADWERRLANMKGKASGVGLSVTTKGSSR